MTQITASGFDWDTGNREKCQKHGLAVEEIEAFFQQEALDLAPDLAHSQTEQRLLAIGRGPSGKPMMVVFVLRTQEGDTVIRPISARYMHEREAKKYERANF